MDKNSQLEELKQLKEQLQEYSEEENAVSKTAIYEGLSSDIKKAMEGEKAQALGPMLRLSKEPPVHSPWSRHDKAAYVDAAILAFITGIFGIIFLIFLFQI